MLFILEKTVKEKPESVKTFPKERLASPDIPADMPADKPTDRDHSGIAMAIAAVRESDPKDLEQRIHFFTLVKDGIQKKALMKDEDVLRSSPGKTAKLRQILDRDLDDTPESDDSSNDDTFMNIRYSFHEEELAKNFYKAASIDYMKLFYGDTGKVPPQFAQDSEYVTGSLVSDTDAETIQTYQAEQSFLAVQYATMVGAHTAVHFKDRNKLDMWIKFNKDLFGMFEHSVALTKEVDYSRIG